jgi:hypothetical protein
LLVALVLVAGVAWAQVWFSTWLENLNATAASDPERAVHEAAQIIRLCEVALSASSVVFAAFFYRFFQLGLRESRIPPSGWWSFGAWRARVGPEARRMSQLGLFLPPLLVASAFVTVVVVECLLRRLLDGRLAV